MPHTGSMAGSGGFTGWGVTTGGMRAGLPSPARKRLGSGRGQGARGVLRRVLLELLAAAHAAEVIGLLVVVHLFRGLDLVDLHAADRILVHGASSPVRAAHDGPRITCTRRA